MVSSRMRERLAALGAVLFVILLASAGSAQFGWNLPVLHQIGRALGLGQ